MLDHAVLVCEVEGEGAGHASLKKTHYSNPSRTH